MIPSLSYFEDLILKPNCCTSVPIKIFAFKGGDELFPQGLFQSLKFVSKNLGSCHRPHTLVPPGPVCMCPIGDNEHLCSVPTVYKLLLLRLVLMFLPNHIFLLRK